MGKGKRSVVKIIFLCTAVLLLLTACAGKSSPAADENRVLTVSPLIQAVEARGDTRLFAADEGLLVLWEREEGFAASYLSRQKSVLVEDVFEGESLSEGVGFLETEPGKGLVAAGGDVWYVLLDRKGAEHRSLGEGISFTGVFYRKEGLICQKGSLLLLVPADLSEKLVLGDAALLPEFERVITVSADGKRVWYLRSEDGRFRGLASFRQGETRVEKSLDLTFDGALSFAPGKVLLWRQAAGETVLTRLDPETEEAVARTIPGTASVVAASSDGTSIAVWNRAEGKISVVNLSTGETVGEKDVAALGEVSALAFSRDGKMLYASLRRDGKELLAALS